MFKDVAQKIYAQAGIEDIYSRHRENDIGTQGANRERLNRHRCAKALLSLSIGTDRGGDVPDHSVNESQASQKPASELLPVPRLHAVGGGGVGEGGEEEEEEQEEDEDENVGGREAEAVWRWSRYVGRVVGGRRWGE